jgi:hypothetical protein
MAGKVDNSLLNKTKRSRDLYLLYVYLPLIILIPLFLLLYYPLQVNINTISLIYLPVLMIYFVFVISLRNKISAFSMTYKYLLMIKDSIGMTKISSKIFTQSWIDKFSSMGYTLFSDYSTHQIYYQFTKKLTGIANRGSVLLLIIISKTNNFDFYSTEVDKQIETLYMTQRNNKRIRKQITFQFIKQEENNLNIIDDMNKIICFKSGDNYLVNINVGYFYNTNEIYYLCPKRKYPNAYYFFACQEIKRMCGIIENE